MRAPSRPRGARPGWIAWTFLLGCGCATTTAPTGWLQDPRVPSNGFGGWMSVALWPVPGEAKPQSWVRSAERVWDLEGELIAVSDDSLFVFAGGSLRGVAWSRVHCAELTGYDSKASGLAAWSVLGTLSTASHGVGLVLTAPIWVIAGVASTAKQTRAGHLVYPRRTASAFAAYARFPQGLPAGIDRAALTGR